MKKGKGKLKAWLKENGKNALGNILDTIGESTSIPFASNIIEGIGERLMDDPDLSDEQKAETKELIKLELEELSLRLLDVDSARNREVELAKTKKNDWMMAVTGITALGSFILMICAVIWIPSVQENQLAIHLLGVVEGASLPIFFYYYGSSKGSKDKTEILGKK